MRGRVEAQVDMFVLGNAEAVVPEGHPLRKVKTLVDEALRRISSTLDAMYAEGGRDSIPPERLLKGQLLIAFYSIRSERQLCEQLRYNLLYRWFLDMSATEAVFVPTVFTHNRDRLLKHEVAQEFFGEVVRAATKARLMSEDHFSVDGTLIEAWASMKSFRPKDEKNDDNDKTPPSGGDANRWVDFHGERLSNETHESKTDPDAKLYRKSKGSGAKLCFGLHVLMENRNGLVRDVRITEANGKTERSAALDRLDALKRPSGHSITVGGDKGYDTADFVADCRARGATPHVAQNVNGRASAIDRRTTKHPGYPVSLRKRMRIEEIFGWVKTTGAYRKTMLRGIVKNQLRAYVIGAAYNLLRVAKLLAQPQAA